MAKAGDEGKESMLDRIEGFIKRSVNRIERAVKKEIHDRDPKRIFSEAGGRPLPYLESFLRDRNVATVTPSSKFVIERVLRSLALEGGETVVEYGPADGVLTGPIADRLGPAGRLVAIERNPDLYEALVRKVKAKALIPVEGDVRDVRRILADRGIERVNRIVSGIPFSFLKPYERGRLLDETQDLLAPGGRFVAYQFTTVLASALELFFPHVKTDFELRNLPPLFLFTCSK
jgi:phospholipid N-methyltransferase